LIQVENGMASSAAPATPAAKKERREILRMASSRGHRVVIEQDDDTDRDAGSKGIM
jgi:hypothetical protein